MNRDELLKVQKGLLDCHNYIVRREIAEPTDQEAYWALTKGLFQEAIELLRKALREPVESPPADQLKIKLDELIETAVLELNDGRGHSSRCGCDNCVLRVGAEMLRDQIIATYQQIGITI